MYDTYAVSRSFASASEYRHNHNILKSTSTFIFYNKNIKLSMQSFDPESFAEIYFYSKLYAEKKVLQA